MIRAFIDKAQIREFLWQSWEVKYFKNQSLPTANHNFATARTETSNACTMLIELS